MLVSLIVSHVHIFYMSVLFYVRYDLCDCIFLVQSVHLFSCCYRSRERKTNRFDDHSVVHVCVETGQRLNLYDARQKLKLEVRGVIEKLTDALATTGKVLVSILL